MPSSVKIGGRTADHEVDVEERMGRRIRENRHAIQRKAPLSTFTPLTFLDSSSLALTLADLPIGGQPRATSNYHDMSRRLSEDVDMAGNLGKEYWSLANGITAFAAVQSLAFTYAVAQHGDKIRS
jgi:hypothetical protein